MPPQQPKRTGSLRLDAEVVARLKVRAAQDRKSMAEVAEKVLRRYLGMSGKS